MNVIFKLVVLSASFLAVAAFFQNENLILHERAEVIAYNKKYLKNLEFYLGHVNRTYKAFNLTADVIRKISTRVMFSTHIFKFLSNEYRTFPVSMRVNLCDHVQEMYDVATRYPQSLSFHNYTNVCPTLPGRYVILNFVIPNQAYPPHLFEGKFMAEFHANVSNEFLSHTRWYGEVRKISRAKHGP